MPQDIDRIYKLAAGAASFDDTLALLKVTQDRAADIRTSDILLEDRKGAVLVLKILIDKLQSARKNLQQRSGGLNTEDE